MNYLFPKVVLSVLFLVVIGNIPLKAQISHGGVPLFYTPSSFLKSDSNENFFTEMPSFNVDSLLKEDKLNEANMRGSFRFAHKFHVNIEKGNTGNNYVLPDGTKVWQTGIRSKGAYSINILFSEYKIPKGAKLFLYNADKTHVIGSFTHENNSADNMLPIRPVTGDEIIVEYQEPDDVEFEGRLKITEVNHDYKGLLKAEPKTEPSSPSTYGCMPDILCADPDNDNLRSVVLLIIDGRYLCTGTLLNTTNNDGEPILLTAIHCLNEQFKNPNVDYVKVAGSIVCFFNYAKPVCNQSLSQIQRMKGSEEMSLAGSVPLSLAIKNDLALLRLNNIPPDYYRPYYAGWNINTDAGDNKPFINIHHPGGMVKKYGKADAQLSISNFETSLFNPQIHWRVPNWTIGSTAGGSSGSPLFDNQGLIIGALSGGGSTCTSNFPDYFFALYKSWEYSPTEGSGFLKDYLDPKNLGVKQWNGYDPYKDYPLTRIKNGDYNGTDSLVNSKLSSPENGLIFGNNSLNTIEFAEEFIIDNDAEIIGAYLLAPTTTAFAITPPSLVKVNAYKEALADENLIASEIFHPTYLDYDTSSKIISEINKTMNQVSTESFVKFTNEVEVGKKFYISYEIMYPSQRDFSIYNMIFKSPKGNTAWLRNAGGNWFPATEHPHNPMSTSLAIEPLIRLHSDTSALTVQKEKNYIIYLPESRQLQINTDNSSETGIINIYSVTGLLLDRISYIGNNPVSISSIPQNNIIIVKATSENAVKTSKFIL